MSTRLVLQVNAAVGIGSGVTAATAMWLVLTRPADVAYAVANHQYGAIGLALAREAAGLLHVLLRFL